MSKIHKHLTVEKVTNDRLKKLAKKERRTEGAIVDLAVEAYAAKVQAANN